MSSLDTHEDGPYIFHQADGSLYAVWLYEGHVWQRCWSAAESANALSIAPRYGYAHSLTIDSTDLPRLPAAVQPAAERLIAISDIHGEYARATHLLRAHGVINHHDEWAAGKATLVVVGDTVDCGSQVTQTLWLLYRLQQQAVAAGGAVYLLSGNHESMLLYGDQSYIHPCYRRNARLLGRDYWQLYGENTVFGQWLRTWPLCLRIGDTLFVHGGISPQARALVRDLDALNTSWRDSLGKPRQQVETDPRTALLHSRHYGPAWYFGYFDNDVDTFFLRHLCRDLGIQRLVVGHATVPHITCLYQGYVIAIDCGLWQGTSGELLFIENDQLSRGLADGSRSELVTA